MASHLPYREIKEIGQGGMAKVYKAEHEDSKTVVALKRPMPWDGCNDRLKREAKSLSSLSHPHVIEVLERGTDEDGDYWYAMPLAVGSLDQLWSAGSLGNDVDTLCNTLLHEVGSGIDALHQAGLIHRDLKPGNILAISDKSSASGIRWVVADLGLVRRPLGQTTHDLTGSAAYLGTLGYIAPEAIGDPHKATTASDIYGLGRILAHVLTGVTPVLNDPLLPMGAWRGVIRTFTHRDEGRRPQNVTDALEQAALLLAEPPPSDQASFRAALDAKGKRLTKVDPLWDVVADNLQDADFVLDAVVEIDENSVEKFAAARPEDAAAIAEAVAHHLLHSEWSDRSFDSANDHLDWILAAIRGLAQARRLDLFEDVAAPYVEAVAGWHRFAHNDRLAPWLRNLPEPEGAIMARVIRLTNVVDYFRKSFGNSYRQFSSPTLSGLLRP